MGTKRDVYKQEAAKWAALSAEKVALALGVPLQEAAAVKRWFSIQANLKRLDEFATWWLSPGRRANAYHNCMNLSRERPVDWSARSK